MESESRLKRIDPRGANAIAHEGASIGQADCSVGRVRGVDRAVSVCRGRLPFAAVIPALRRSTRAACEA
jgi:hypothetical protein